MAMCSRLRAVMPLLSAAVLCPPASLLKNTPRPGPTHRGTGAEHGHLVNLGLTALARLLQSTPDKGTISSRDRRGRFD